MKENLLEGMEAKKEEKTIDEVEEEEYTKSQEEPETPEKPEGLDDSLWDDEKKSIKQDDLLNAYKKEQEKALGLRRKLSEKGETKPPKDIKEYVLDESLNEILPEDGEVTNLIKEKALEAGLTKDKFGDFMSKLMPALNEKGVISQNKELSEEEAKAEYEQYKEQELAKLGKDGTQIMQSLVNWGDSLINKGILSKDELPVYENMATDAASMAVLMKIRSLTGESGIPVKTTVTDGLPSRAEIDNMIASEAYQNGDAKVHKQVKEYFETTT